MIYFVNKIYFSDKKYQTNGTVRDNSYKVKLIFPIKEFLSFGTDLQSTYFMSKILLRDDIDGFCVPQFQVAYIRNTKNNLHKNLVSFAVKYIICGG